ncbi:MAG: CocE/NonD family hydrolase, partial [Ferruginibacter sp.]
MIRFYVSFAFLLATISTVAQNEDSSWFVNNYTKIERQIPMRDGIKLFTSIYIPKDKTEKHPFLLTRTPYSCAPYGEANFTSIWDEYRMAYAKENYILVRQDVRGRYMSEGEYMDVRPFNKDKKSV